MRTVRFLPGAELEFRESALWYLSQQKGLEAEFVRCIDECISSELLLQRLIFFLVG